MKNPESMTDQYRQILGSGIHDAIVQAFRFVQGDCFEICLRDGAGKEKWISLHGVSRIGFKDIVNGTIISEVFLWKIGGTETSNNPTDEAWRALFGGNYNEADLEKLIVRSQEQHATQLFVFFESSYGGSIASICHDICTQVL